jgi:N-acetylglutamate synthase-like GNAT family acetyltransferase
MLINLKSRLNEYRIQELIEYSVFPDPERVKVTLRNYKDQEDLMLMGYESEGNLIGTIGYRIDENRILEIKHISVDPLERGQGHGRIQIIELIQLLDPLEVYAETDHESVDFYRNIGFIITSLGEKHSGVERFKCI